MHIEGKKAVEFGRRMRKSENSTLKECLKEDVVKECTYIYTIVVNIFLVGNGKREAN